MIIRILLGLFACHFAFATPAQKEQYSCLSGLAAYNKAATGKAMYELELSHLAATYSTDGKVIYRSPPRSKQEVWNIAKCDAHDDCRVDPKKHHPPSAELDMAIKYMIITLFEEMYVQTKSEAAAKNYANAILACKDVRDIQLKLKKKSIAAAVGDLKKQYATAFQEDGKPKSHNSEAQVVD